MDRRSFITGIAASATLFSAGCFPLLALSRVVVGRGLATGMARASVARSVAVTSSIGRSNAMAARTFAWSRQTRRMNQAELDRLARDEQRRNSISASEALRVVRAVRQLDRLNANRDDGSSFATCYEVSGDTV